MLLNRDNYIIYPVPLEDGKVARLELPETFTKKDADKIARVIKALAAYDGDGTLVVPNGDQHEV